MGSTFSPMLPMEYMVCDLDIDDKFESLMRKKKKKISNLGSRVTFIEALR